MTEQELKSVTFSEEDLKENSFLGVGVHEVEISAVKFDSSTTGKIFLNVEVEKDGATGSARLFFSEEAKKYSIDKIRGIFVHNCETDGKKQQIRDFFKTITTLADLNKIIDRLVGKKCWYKNEKTEETYVDRNGDEKYRYNKDIAGYEMKMKVEKNDEPVDYLDEPVDLSEIPF
jgi:hypothetical protein